MFSRILEHEVVKEKVPQLCCFLFVTPEVGKSRNVPEVEMEYVNCIPALPLPSCVSSDKGPKLSVPQFPHLEMVLTSVPSQGCWLIECLTQCQACGKHSVTVSCCSFIGKRKCPLFKRTDTTVSKWC